jgi:PPOX class probable F420-dependent enzyme
MRGKVKSEPVEAVATVLDDSETEAVYRAINKRYGIVGQIFNFFSKLRGGAKRTVGLEIRPA